MPWDLDERSAVHDDNSDQGSSDQAGLAASRPLHAVWRQDGRLPSGAPLHLRRTGGEPVTINNVTQESPTEQADVPPGQVRRLYFSVP